MKFSVSNTFIFIVVFLIISTSLLFFVGPEFIQSRYYYIDAQEQRGQIGDSFGGTIGPVIAWIAAVLTFLAFFIQYQANKEQRKQFAKQADDTVIERFENRYFEMIRIHLSNVNEQNIQDKIRGRKAFTTYYFELRYIYFVLEKNYDESSERPRLDKEELGNLAYLIFYFGIGHVTKDVFENIASKYTKYNFFQQTIDRLRSEQAEYSKDAKGSYEVKHNGQIAVFIKVYQPFTGHGTKIGHYYRHLYETVKYVAGQTHHIFTDELKYSYVTMVRAQLSNFEQVIFYYNSISILGRAWTEQNYLRDYKMIINLPLSFADFGVLPEDKFKEEIENDADFFDWITLKDKLR